MSNKIKRKRDRLYQAEQVGILTMMHFPHKDPEGKEDPFEDLSCSECVDFLQGLCNGENREGWEVVKCMENKVRMGEVGFFVAGSDEMQ